ncbi:uncharacterized protein NEMAJ01_1061 [Nematocida major]|uniref:uncharacterized protein n=1 Tax=Nematocida major TaxID=1912982 RepID=UPI002007C93F|nr:uncharacterized protein NEMAJ01_1061 [Nematocida major]KAH9386165.1 hypothetical protein NEMAJ01_1061 [Nematocida major]
MGNTESEKDELSKEEKISAEKYAKSLAQYENSLALDRPSTFLKILKVPGLVFFSGIGGYILGWLEFKPWVIIPLLYAIGFVFIRRIKEFKRSMEAFVYFSIRKQNVSKYEKVDWMNAVAEKAWRYVESTVSKILLLRISAMLRNIKIPMVNDIRLDRFTLGGQAPVIEGIRIRHSSRDSLIVDVAMHFIPAMAKDLQGTPGEASINWGSNITMAVRVGGAAAGIDMPVTLKNVSFRGSVRLKINFTYDASVIEGVEFSFLKQPVIGFNIVPLKIIDIMDIPGLASGIKKVIEMGIQKEALYPKRISVAMKPKSMYYVGAISVHIHKVVTHLKGDIFLSIGINGRKGRNPVRISQGEINHVAYIPIKNTDDMIFIFIQKKEDESPIAMGTMSIEKICMQGRAQGIVPFSNSQGYTDVSFSYYPKIDVGKISEEERPKSAIVTVKLVQLIDMVDVLGAPYKSLTVQATACMRQKRVRNKDPASMSAAELMPEEKNSASPGMSVTNESSTESDEDLKKQSRTHLLSNEVLGVFNTGVARNEACPAFDDKFVFYTRDTKRTIILIEARDKDKVLGSFSVNIRRGVSISYGTFDFWHMAAGRAKLLFSAEYACMIKINMQKYTHIRMVKIDGIETKGVFSGYLVTANRVVPVRPFFSHATGKYSGYALVPILSTHEVTKYVAYLMDEVYGGCDVMSGESYLGEAKIKMQTEDYPLHKTEEKDESLPAPPEKALEEKKLEGSPQEKGEVEASSLQNVQSSTDEKAASTECVDGGFSPFIQMRVVFCRVNHPIFLEFAKDDIVIDRSASSSGKKLHGEFFFFTNVSISVYTVKEGFLIGKFYLSKSSGRHEIKLAHKQLFVIDVYNRQYSGLSAPLIHHGLLSVHILGMQASEAAELEVYKSVFVEASVGEQAHVTASSQDVTAPEFNKNFSFSVYTPVDTLELKVFGWTHLKEKKFLGEVSLPLFSIAPGESSICTGVPAMSIDSTASVYKINANLILQENGRV